MIEIQGMTVILYEQKKTGADPFGAPVYSLDPVPVDDVLVAPASFADQVQALDLTGKKAVYTLGIPKTDQHEWQDKTVEFFGAKWKTFGFVIEGIKENIPTRWDRKVMVERYGS